MRTSFSLFLGAIGLSVVAMSACSGGGKGGGSGGSAAIPPTGGTATSGGSGSGGAPTSGGAASGGGGAGGELGMSIDIDKTWVSKAGNTAEIQGAFYILEDKVKDGVALSDGLTHSVFTADTGPVDDAGVDKFGPDTEAPCISGTAVQVRQADGTTACDPNDGTVPCAYDLFWGGGIGLNLNETGEVDGAPSVQSPYDAVAHGVTGFKFGISGDVGGATIRVKATQDGNPDDFCKTITVTPDNSVVEVSLSELEHSCWEPDGAPLDLTKLMALQWQIVTDVDSSHEVKNFCINSLEWF